MSSSAAASTDSGPISFTRRTRLVVHPRACSTGGGSFASSSDGSRAVIAGNDVLRLIKISDIARQSNEHQNVRLAVGPGGATIETSPNMWPSSGLKVDSAPTDVIWGKGAFDNKIVTSARNGEIIYWDISRLGNKFESRVKEHKRAITQLSSSPSLSYMFASGSQDGHLRVWDFRSPTSSVLKVPHATGIRTLALCPVPSHPMHVCVGLESGTIQRWDLRSKAQPLERVTLAHSCAVLSMDWQSPSMHESGLGWLVTSGMDRSVKIWDLTIPPANITSLNDKEKILSTMKMGSSGSFRTLHPSFVGRHVKWRSSTEIAIVSNIDSDSDSIVEIWDVRRGWIGKWALQRGAEGVEGNVTDIAFASENILHTLHTSGSFVQYDLNYSLIKPMDAIPRNALAWSATGEMVFVTGLKDEHEVPFDDAHSRMDSAQYSKDITEPPYIPVDQTLGVLSIIKDPASDLLTEFNTLLELDAKRVTRLAQKYIFRSHDIDGGRKEICVANAKIADVEGDYEAARVWKLLSTLLNDQIDSDGESAEHEAEVQPSHSTPPPQLSLLSLPPESRSIPIDLNQNDVSHTEDTGHLSASPLMVRTMTTTVASPSPVTHSSTLTLNFHEKNEEKSSNVKQEDSQRSPVSMYDASISSAGKGEAAGSKISPEPSTARRSLAAQKRPDPGFRGSTVYANMSSTPAKWINDLSRLNVGEGALDSSDDENDALKSEGGERGPHIRSAWNRSQLTSMIEEQRKQSDGLVPLSTTLRISEEDHRENVVSPGIMTRSTSAKSFSESFESNNTLTKPPHPRLSLSVIRDIDYPKSNNINVKPVSTSISSNMRIQMSKLGRHNQSPGNLSSPSSSLSKSISQTTRQSPHTPSIYPAVRARSGKPTPSPLSRVFTPQSHKEGHVSHFQIESPDGRFSDEEDNSSGSESHSDLEEIVSDLSSDMEAEDGSDDSSQLNHPSRLLIRSNSVPVPSLVSSTDSLTWNVPKRTQSRSNIRTLTVAVPSRPPSILSDQSRRYVEEGSAEGDQVSASERIMQDSSTSTRRPSPAPTSLGNSGSGAGANTGLGLVNMTTEVNTGGNESISNVSIHRMRPINLTVPSLEKKWRNLVWREVRKNFERLSETGNVQMCAMLAILVPKELKLRKAAIQRHIGAYVELLSRLRQYILASHVRKYTEQHFPENIGQINIYSACGRCNSSVVTTTQATNAVLLCPKCKSRPNHCSICRLPVRKLLIHCSVCGHGGHDACYRSYMTNRPATEVSISNTAISLFSNPFSLFTMSANSLPLGSGSSFGSSVVMEDSTSIYYSFSETTSGGESFEEDENELTANTNPGGSEPSTDILRKTRLGTQSRPMQVWGHACPTGCGHWCWGTNERNGLLHRS